MYPIVRRHMQFRNPAFTTPEWVVSPFVYRVCQFKKGRGHGIAKRYIPGKHTVDGSEIRANSPVEVGSLFPLFLGFYTSQVGQDFFHQQHLCANTHMPLYVSTHSKLMAEGLGAKNKRQRRTLWHLIMLHSCFFKEITFINRVVEYFLMYLGN